MSCPCSVVWTVIFQRVLDVTPQIQMACLLGNVVHVVTSLRVSGRLPGSRRTTVTGRRRWEKKVQSSRFASLPVGSQDVGRPVCAASIRL